ncbi:MAG: L,D-transpeptidase [Verrucomicrobiales bacterium]|nr:L,D-transpeptidase [Verrucomicrobiales bacterium]
MKRVQNTILLAVFAGLCFSGCSLKQNHSVKPTPVKVKNPEDVRVKVSLNNRAVYVFEKDKPLLVAAVAIGKNGHATPKGQFKAFNKQTRKRSGSYGFHIKPGTGEIIPGKRSKTPSGWSYVGYPMPYWVEFKSGYGFHAGAVWPTPRTHGCLRLHKSVAPRFFSLVDDGTPIEIAQSLPEDRTLGKSVYRPDDYQVPNSPNAVLISDAPFTSNHVYF